MGSIPTIPTQVTFPGGVKAAHLALDQRTQVRPLAGELCQNGSEILLGPDDNDWLWLSLVERRVRDAEVVGSNPTSQTQVGGTLIGSLERGTI